MKRRHRMEADVLLLTTDVLDNLLNAVCGHTSDPVLPIRRPPLLHFPVVMIVQRSENITGTDGQLVFTEVGFV
jgi:hypothetical protein